jgi:predicted dehydrogenase
MNKIRFGVIGAGKIGTYHVRTLAKMREVELVGVADIDLLRAQTLAWDNNTIAYGDFNDLLPQVDAVVIATPTELHAPMALKAMSMGIHTFIEKPICNSIEDAKKLNEASIKNNVVLQVGHVERFNVAFVEAQKYIKNPLYINMERLGPYDPRVSSIGVTLDLMIHDLDILLSIANSEIDCIDCIGARVFSDFEDISNARIRFKNGMVADITASRITFERVRRMRIYQEGEYISIDYISSKVKIYRPKNLNPKNLSDIEILTPKIEKKLPITEELYHFIDCIKNSKKPITDATKSTTALKLAIEIVENMKRYDLPRFEEEKNKTLGEKIADGFKSIYGIIDSKIDNIGK